MTTEGTSPKTSHSCLEGALVRLRAVEESDLVWINRNFWNPEVTRFLTVVWPEPLAGTRAFWERTRTSDDTVVLLIETLDGEPLGVCGLDGIQARGRTAELGIWIAEPRWSHGYGTDAVRTLCRFGFREMNLHRITLHVYDLNPRGVVVYKKVGVRQEGLLRGDQFVDGRHVDVILMGMLAGELTEP